MFEGRFFELLIIFVLALVVLGPEKLPRVVSQLGRWVGRARAMARQFREQLEEEVILEESRRTQARAAQPEPEPGAAGTASEPQTSPSASTPAGTAAEPQPHSSASPSATMAVEAQSQPSASHAPAAAAVPQSHPAGSAQAPSDSAEAHPSGRESA
jgi:sec-independent protein translocase protein TatB